MCYRDNYLKLQCYFGFQLTFGYEISAKDFIDINDARRKNFKDKRALKSG